jgi:hypothetical protein
MLFAQSQAVAAQDVAYSFGELRGVVRPDVPVTVMDNRFSERKGRIAELTPSMLTLEVDGRLLTFAEGDVARIRQQRRDSLSNGALWGAGVAASVLTVAGILHHQAGTGVTSAEWMQSILVFTGMCTGIGIGIDALNDADQVIYRYLPRQQTSVSPGSAIQSRGARAFISFQF